MHICTIGDGAAGLMAANFFATRDYVSKVTHIGSSKIPSIGVGESTTLSFEILHRMFDDDFNSFILQSDACVKTGVMYVNWSEKEFLHFFKPQNLFEKYDTDFIRYSNSLANKDKNTHIHDIFGTKLYSDSKQNKIPLLKETSYHGWSWHFDASRYISYLKRLLRRNKSKVTIIDDIVIDCNFKEEELINYITLQSNQEIKADYYVIATGKSTNSSNIFKIKYHDLSNVLLTDKALFFPKPYQNKREEMHPYTIAKTMKNGWRWITPTWSRVGTGYVFSSNHITVEQAVEEFQQDIGDSNVIPNVVDFHPKYNVKSFNKNYLTLGMCNGFLEPLDAPGLSISCSLTLVLDQLFKSQNYISNIIQCNHNQNNNSSANEFTEELYKGWAAFILTQYKTCHRTDTQFWIDHKNVKFDYFDNLMRNLYNDLQSPSRTQMEVLKKDIVAMIQNTIASRNIQWKTDDDSVPIKLDDSGYETIHHYDFLSSI